MRQKAAAQEGTQFMVSTIKEPTINKTQFENTGLILTGFSEGIEQLE